MGGPDRPDQLHAFVLWWHNLAMVRRDLLDRGLGPTMPTTAARCSDVLRRAVLDVLVRTGRMPADKAARMDAIWPDVTTAGPGPSEG